jgi:hypothetical protein
VKLANECGCDMNEEVFDDLECNVTPSKSDGEAYCEAESAAVRAGGRIPSAYVDETFARSGANIARFYKSLWAAGSRPKLEPGARYAMLQSPQANQRIGGGTYDLDEVPEDGPGPVIGWAGEAPVVVPDPSPSPPAPVTVIVTPAPSTVQPEKDGGTVYPSAPAGQVWKLVTAATDDELGEFIAACARPWAGLSDAPATRTAFRNVVGPEWLEGPSMSAAMAGSWCCAETGLGLERAIFRYASSKLKALLKAFSKYVIGAAMVNVQQDAGALGCLKHARDGLPRQASSVLIDGGEHDISCITGKVVEMEPTDTVEGGNCVMVGAKQYMSISGGHTRVFYASGAIGSADGKAHHTEYAWLDWILGMRNAAKVDPTLAILVDALPAQTVTAVTNITNVVPPAVPPEPAMSTIPPTIAPSGNAIVEATPLWKHVMALFAAGGAGTAGKFGIDLREGWALAFAALIIIIVFGWLIVRHKPRA